MTPRPPARSPTFSSTCPAPALEAARTPSTLGSPTRRCAGTTAPTTSSGRPDLLHLLTAAPPLTSVLNALKFAPSSYRLIPILLRLLPTSSAPFWHVGLITLQGARLCARPAPGGMECPGAATATAKATSRRPATAGLRGPRAPGAYRPSGPPLGHAFCPSDVARPSGVSALGAGGLRESVCVQVGLFKSPSR